MPLGVELEGTALFFMSIRGCIFVCEMIGHATLLTARSLRKPKDTQTCVRKSTVSFGYTMGRLDLFSGPVQDPPFRQCMFPYR